MEKEEKKHHRGRRKGKNNFLSNLILVVAVVAFCYSAFQLYTIWDEYRQIDEEYEDMQSAVLHKDAVTVLDEGEEVEQVVFKVDFDKLHEINKDVVGWIRFDEPATISYPIAHGDSNKEYLRHTLEKKYSTAGTIFVDYRNESDFEERNTFVYGHNMRNGSMFGQLKKYIEEDFLRKFPCFYIYTPDGTESVYRIFSVRIVNAASEAFDLKYANDDEFMDYVDAARRASYHDTSDVEVTEDSKIITLSTCSKKDDERLLIHAVRIAQKQIEE